MTLTSDVKYEEKFTLGSKNDIRELMQNLMQPVARLKICTLV